ncbi:FAD-dependent oxidoreductase [Hyphomicrobium nitrativorans NL23]|uniref:FAD-dependent oxidoreductase n=1 Tax=Hyphomicrobium nitrativorans NL23 TaxID=1029756 RepID=V5SFX0_9HYPH|nr:NAD(P)/FAD-dependent oxidoreductase [Hyphomicrobium nitrativorans]AHB49433.1 FAD-dependent oxidoreductase [Hyphomicrobium nitrativorans NL23]
MAPDIETVVIGAGVVGLAVARALVARGHEVLVLERHGGIGQETSSRSSEVIHAGLYYAPGSLKARFCVEGRDLLYAFARENGVPHMRYGKLLVATRESEIPRLDALAGIARANGVTDIARLSAEDVKAREPDVSAVAALYSPSTGVIDSHALMVALEGHVRAGSGSVVLETRVTALGVRSDGAYEIVTDSGEASERAVLTSRNLVIAAGLGATMLGESLGGQPGYAVPRTYPARGHYYALEGPAPFRHLVYPMPSEGWLGIHLTLDVTGRAKFGPDLEWQAESSYVFDDAEGVRRARFVEEIRRYWPGLAGERLVPAYVGVRPKIYAEGEAAPDFTIHTEREHGRERLVALYGIESPGLTSALAIGAFVAELFGR